MQSGVLNGVFWLNLKIHYKCHNVKLYGRNGVEASSDAKSSLWTFNVQLGQNRKSI